LPIGAGAFFAAAVFSSCYSSDIAASFCQRDNRHMSARTGLF
jgi:hypothetical protein